MKKGTILIVIIGAISPVLWWFAFHLLQPTAMQSNSVPGLTMSVAIAAIASIIACIFLSVYYENN